MNAKNLKYHYQTVETANLAYEIMSYFNIPKN